jgi:hypothetical protein
MKLIVRKCDDGNQQYQQPKIYKTQKKLISILLPDGVIVLLRIQVILLAKYFFILCYLFFSTPP